MPDIPPSDILVHAGDSTGHGTLHELREFLTWLEAQPAAAKVLIAGNHCWEFERNEAEARALVKELAPSVYYLQDSGVTLMGLRFWGSPYTPRFLDWAFNCDRGSAIRAHWDKIPTGEVDVLVTHGPPSGAGDLDYVPRDRINVGDRDLYDAIRRVRPVISVHGHLHHGYGLADILHEDGTLTTCYNAAICTEDYQPVNEPWVVEAVPWRATQK